MKWWAIVFLMIIVLCGCWRQPTQPAAVLYEDPRSLTHISETGRLKIGMHESEVVKILGSPVSRERGFFDGHRLWFKLYNPKYETIPSNFLISTDKYGYVTFISDGG